MSGVKETFRYYFLSLHLNWIENFIENLVCLTWSNMNNEFSPVTLNQCPDNKSQRFHYENMSVQYTAIFHGCKNDKFQMKNRDFFSLIFAQNIDCGYK